MCREQREVEVSDRRLFRCQVQFSDLHDPRPLGLWLQLTRDPFKEQRVPMNSQSAICKPFICSPSAPPVEIHFSSICAITTIVREK